MVIEACNLSWTFHCTSVHAFVRPLWREMLEIRSCQAAADGLTRQHVLKSSRAHTGRSAPRAPPASAHLGHTSRQPSVHRAGSRARTARDKGAQM